MGIAVIIQARVGSTRFPNKMTLPFYGGQGILHFLISRMLKANISAPLILAIPDSSENDILQKIGRDLGVKIFRGSENDVLQRFIDASIHFNATSIIRVCADNPFLDMESIPTLINALSENEFDYISYCLADGTPTIKTHYGFWPEAVRLTTLQTVAAQTKDRLYREHVTNYIYTNSILEIPPGEINHGHTPIPFTRHCIRLNPEIEYHSWARFTVDTANDFQNMKHLVAELSSLTLLSPDQLINYVADNIHIKTSMQEEINKNQK